MSETKTYPVLSPVRHNGTRYAPDTENETIELTDKEYNSLKAIGCVGEPEDTDDTAFDPQLSDEERADKIQKAIEGLDAETDFKKDGGPKATSVNTLLDFEATAEEIGAVWDKIKPANQDE